jgi:plastocyanin
VVLRRPLAAAALAAFAASAAAQPAEPRPGGVVRGRVDVRREAAPIEPRPAVSALGLTPRRQALDRWRSVVYLASAPQAAFVEDDRARAVLDQRDQTFVPYVLAVAAGTTVEFPNNDPTYHNVFSLSKARRFDLGRYPKGQSKAVRFDRSGVVRVFCEMHSHMTAWILVFAHRYFATTDAEGRYAIDGIPPGQYEVVVWNDGQDRETKTVRVTEGGVAELDFVVR